MVGRKKTRRPSFPRDVGLALRRQRALRFLLGQDGWLSACFLFFAFCHVFFLSLVSVGDGGSALVPIFHFLAVPIKHPAPIITFLYYYFYSIDVLSFPYSYVFFHGCRWVHGLPPLVLVEEQSAENDVLIPQARTGDFTGIMCSRLLAENRAEQRARNFENLLLFTTNGRSFHNFLHWAVISAYHVNVDIGAPR